MLARLTCRSSTRLYDHLSRNCSLFTAETSTQKYSRTRHQRYSRMADRGPVVGQAPGASTHNKVDQVTTPANGEAPSKSSLKKAEKVAAAAAKKAMKEAAGVKQSTAAGEGKKKEKKQVEAVEEPAFIEVPKGNKKDMSNPMASGYNPVDVEKSWYSWWEKCNYFVPALPSKTPNEHSFYDNPPRFLKRNEQSTELDLEKEGISQEQVFVIPFPPPNVTGSLHIGHALAFGIQDTLIRWHRMRGFVTLFVPGFDHAGISTQSVVEKRLAKLEGLSRHDLGRQKFLERCMSWKEDYQGRITKQIQRLGLSCDWDRVAFTMNQDLSSAVVDTFVKLHEDGILYRANRLVNWCVAMNTTLSNLEVDQKIIPGRTLMNVPGYPLNEKFEFGVLTSFAYEIEGSDEKIVIATTRPETMLGDTAVAVHPDDKRYTHLHGKYALHPFLKDRRMPIVCDSIAVDMEFGTGAVKITPAHDPNDYEVGLRHKLDFINILNDDGTLNASCGPEFEGKKRFHARNLVVEKMKAKGLYVGQVDNPMSIPVCAKSGDVIESVMKPQWWVNCKEMAEAAIKKTEAGELKIKPLSSEKEWYNWLGNIQDWCISRQLWWGHRAPAYFVTVDGMDQDRLSGEYWVVGRTREEAQKKAELKFPKLKFTLEQDEDVLDTWFSSGLWPWSIQGWPKETPDLKAFYPSSLLETGWDILFFWVARMVLLGIHLTGKLPFSEVFCHAMIRDAHGRKMSKSLGNVIDPVDVIEGATLESLHAQLRVGNLAEKEIALAEKGQKKDFPSGIPQCGVDALRFTLCNYSTTGRDINLEINRVEGYRKFCNKLWNATKFAMLKFEESFVPEASEKLTGKESLVEKWILHKMKEASDLTNQSLADRHFMNATSAIYSFWLYEICDVYIEAIKLVTDPSATAERRRSAQNTLYTVLDNGLKLLHPFMPFVTEELWQRLPRRPTDQTPSIMLSRYPENLDSFENHKAVEDFDLAFLGVRTARSLAVEYGAQKNLQVYFVLKDPTLIDTYNKTKDELTVLIKGCTALNFVASETDVPAGCVSESLSTDLTVHLLLKGVIDADAEILKAQKKKAFTEASIMKLEEGMAAPNYVEKKPESVRESEQKRLRDYEAEIASLRKAIENFAKLK